MIITILVFVLVLSVLVFAHELGHFMTARWFGIKAEEFGFGFPPRVWGVYKSYLGKWKRVRGNKEVLDAASTIYSINAIPLGGFVKIKGENGDEKDEKDSFVSRPIWQRFIVLSAGVLMNIILAMALFGVGYMIGLPKAVEDAAPGAKISNLGVQIMDILPESPAARAGLQVGDKIISINGEEIKEIIKAQELIASDPLKESSIKISRDGLEQELKVKPELLVGEEKPLIGIAMIETGTVKYPFFKALYYGVRDGILITWAIIVAFYELIKGLIMGQGVGGDVAGPVGIANLTGQAARLGFVYLMQFVALLSLNLAVINFLPFPALDGGRSLFLLIEKIKGSPVKREVENVFHNIGFYLLMALIVWITFKDVLGLFK